MAKDPLLDKVNEMLRETRAEGSLKPRDALHPDDSGGPNGPIQRSPAGWPTDLTARLLEIMVQQIVEALPGTAKPHEAGDFGDMKNHWGTMVTWKGRKWRIVVECLGEE